jgi:hypothetical protein
MPLSLPILAAGITIIVPGFLAGNVFLVLLHLWVDRRLQTDSSVRERLRIDIGPDTFGWALTPENDSRPWPFGPLMGAALAAVLLTVAESAVFGFASDVPHLWYLAGAIALPVAAVLPFIVAGLLRNALGRRVDRMLAQRANERFAFALPLLFAVTRIDAQSDELYASLALHAPARALEDCRRIVFDNAGAKQDVVLSALEATRNAADRDLRNLTSLATEIRAGTTLVERANDRRDEAHSLKDEAARVAEAIRSRALADALETGRWSDASLAMERIRPDLDKLSAALDADTGMPQSVEDAYRLLDVRDDTQLESIKTILSAYRRIWHPDRARDDAERVLFTLKTQRLNVAWDLIQRARGPVRRDGEPSSVDA